MAKYTEGFKAEIPDPNPVPMPPGFETPLSLEQQIQRMIRTHMSKQAADEGYETFEESDDFEIEDEEDFVSPYEMTEMVWEGPPDASAPEINATSTKGSKTAQERSDAGQATSPASPGGKRPEGPIPDLPAAFAVGRQGNRRGSQKVAESAESQKSLDDQ